MVQAELQNSAERRKGEWWFRRILFYPRETCLWSNPSPPVHTFIPSLLRAVRRGEYTAILSKGHRTPWDRQSCGTLSGVENNRMHSVFREDGKRACDTTGQATFTGLVEQCRRQLFGFFLSLARTGKSLRRLCYVNAEINLMTQRNQASQKHTPVLWTWVNIAHHKTTQMN